MADEPQQREVIQRMIDAGEPEEAIALVVQHFQTPQMPLVTSGETAATARAMEHKMFPLLSVDRSTPVLTEEASPATSTPSNLQRTILSLASTASPHSATDFLPLVLPNAIRMGAPKMPAVIAATGRGVEHVADELIKTKAGFGVGAITAMASHNVPAAIAEMVAPHAAKYVGRGMQRIGAALDDIQPLRFEWPEKPPIVPSIAPAVSHAPTTGSLPPTSSPFSSMGPPMSAGVPGGNALASKMVNSAYANLGSLDSLTPVEAQTLKSRPGALPELQEMSPIESQALATPAPKMSVASQVPPSRSSGAQGAGSETSATPGLTRNDVMSLGMNPDIPIRKLTALAANSILEARKLRKASYGELYNLEQRLKHLTSRD